MSLTKQIVNYQLFNMQEKEEKMTNKELKKATIKFKKIINKMNQYRQVI